MTRQRLWTGLYFPRFPLETLTRASDEHVCDIVVNDSSTAPRVVALAAEMADLGVHEGMLLSSALAIEPQLVTRLRQPDSERDTLRELAAWASQYTSLVCPVSGEHVGLLLEIGESLRLFGKTSKLLSRIHAGIDELGFTGIAAVAPTPTAAWLLARSGRSSVVTRVADLPDALGTLPLSCLDLEPRALQSLADVGVQQLQQCWHLPRAETARRIGPELYDILDRALARRPDVRKPYRVPERLRHKLNLPAPVVGVEALLFALGRLLRQLEGVLLARGNAVQVLELELGLSGSASDAVAIELIAPSRDVKHLLGLLRHRLEAMRLDEPVEQLTLEATQCVSLAPRNLDLFDQRVAHEDEWLATLERLHARLGVESVQGIALGDEHRPEHAWRPVTPRQGFRHETTSVAEVGAHRPLWLLAEPRSLKTRDGVPVYGGLLQIETSAERIEGGWWEGHDDSRDYHVATSTAGARYWIFHDRRARAWYLHGVFG